MDNLPKQMNSFLFHSSFLKSFPLLWLNLISHSLKIMRIKNIFPLYDFKHLELAVSRLSPVARNCFFHSLVKVETNFPSKKTCHSTDELELSLVIWPMANSDWHKSRSKNLHHQHNSIKNCTYRHISASWSSKLGTHMHVLSLSSTLLPPKNHPWIRVMPSCRNLQEASGTENFQQAFVHILI